MHRFVIVGAGVISTRHAEMIRAFGAEAELVGVVDRDAQRAESWAAARSVPWFTDLASALAATAADVVVVCTPTSLHGDVAIEALEAGRHVVIEKPADTTPDRIDDIVAAQRAAGTIVTVISQHRFDPATEHVLAAVRTGALGRLTSGTAQIDLWRGQSYYDSGAWRGTWRFDGGGALMNQGVHTVDLLLAIMGPAVEVTGYIDTLAHERMETEDIAVGIVRFASGALGTIHATTGAYPGLDTRVQIHGDRGSAVIVNDALEFFHSTPADRARAEVLMGRQGESLNHLERDPVPVENVDSMTHQYRDLLAALRGERDVRVGLAQNRDAVALITGLYESARTRRPVALATAR